MKIIYLHQYFNTPSMSGGTRSYEMARRLVSAGHEVHMVTSFRDTNCLEKDWFSTNESGINVHWLPVPYNNKLSYSKRIQAFFIFAFKAMRKAKELDGDVIFATSTPLTIALPGVLASKRKKIPMVFEVRDLWPELPIAMGAIKNPLARWLAHKLEKWAYHHSAAIIALSPGMKAGVVKSGYPASKVAVIPNSSDNKEFSHDSAAAIKFRNARVWLGDKPLIVYTGTFGKINGVGYMVELAKKLLPINPDIRVLLVGGGFEKELIAEKAKESGVLGVNLFIEGYLPKKDIPDLLSAADMAACLFIDMPEMQPNSANKFFDSLASGTPVLLNYGGWMHDLVNSHQCGLAMWKVPLDDVARLVANKITDINWLKSAGYSAKMLAMNEFDRDKLAVQFEDVLNCAVQSKCNDVAAIAPGDYCVKKSF
ncbi:glycosyltransferase family 4 protein [Vibrio navarrensis]|uniref:glycosyltransferase family 4 protein n=1 Tax=Vibrio navarrensis TaxID=29495 RepID=UPI00051DBC48|nr:glycosyltransferase family 4 protein [Vibrio navarrensis]KGK15797.1 glycosyl transferase family 1 [Vibrio navarrensis]